MPPSSKAHSSPFLELARITRESALDQPSTFPKPSGFKDVFGLYSPVKFELWVKNNGGWQAFAGKSRAEVEQEYLASGAFTDRAQVPGDAPDPAIFAGPRRDTNRTSVSDLKITLPKIPVNGTGY